MKNICVYYVWFCEILKKFVEIINFNIDEIDGFWRK
jgi:hypothetical protein